jgi:GH24 family phage-related lysozyme (muramidase)
MWGAMPDMMEKEMSEEERAFREREVAVKEREQAVKEAELALKQTEHASSRWRNPLVLAILAAAIAAAGNAYLADKNATSQIALETHKSEQTRILEMIKTGNPDKAAENLRFLLETGLIRDPNTSQDLRKYLDNRKPGTGPALPSALGVKDLPDLFSKFEGNHLKPYKGPIGETVIGYSHVLTQEEASSGILMIDGKTVDFRSGITEEQAKKLLEQDLAPIKAEIGSLVKVPLTTNQMDALTSFVFHVGLAPFKGSSLLRKLNAGQYEAIPDELMKWVIMSNQVVPGYVARRQYEIALWNKP